MKILILTILMTLAACGNDKDDDNKDSEKTPSLNQNQNDGTSSSDDPIKWLQKYAQKSVTEYGLKFDEPDNLEITKLKLKAETDSLSQIKKFPKLKYLFVYETAIIDFSVLGDLNNTVHLVYDEEKNKIDPKSDAFKNHLLFIRNHVCHITYLKAFTYNVKSEADLLELFKLKGTMPIFKDPSNPSAGFEGAMTADCPKDDVTPEEYKNAILKP